MATTSFMELPNGRSRLCHHSHILSLGAGVQSTTLYLLFLDGKLKPELDAAINADTQEEPMAVYEHLDWLRSLHGIPILSGTRGKLGDDVMYGIDSRKRHVSIPAWAKKSDGSRSIIPRQCTREYKVDVVWRITREQFLGRKRLPRNWFVHQYIGISLDEAGRAERVKKNQKHKQIILHFPLLDMGWTRNDCIEYLSHRVPHVVPKSSCVFCPYHDDNLWLHLKTEDPVGFARAIEVDESIRNGAYKSYDAALFLHRSLVPLRDVVFEPTKYNGPAFTSDCHGMCGN
jgi:hypothetical protein